MNHAFYPLFNAAMRLSQPFYNMYLTCLRFSGEGGSVRLLGLHGRAKDVVLFDRTMAGEKRGAV